jgi:4-amino-4-deoxy-L-arabinose transferase-like glycosyltransferase
LKVGRLAGSVRSWWYATLIRYGYNCGMILSDNKVPPRLAAFLLLLLLSTLTALQVGQEVRQFAHYPPDFDEAVHLLPIVQVANALQRGDLAAFWQATNEQDQLAAYPFVHSWLSAPVWLVRPGITPQRWFNLLLVVASILVAFTIGHRLASTRRWLAGLVSGGLILASLPIWLFGSLVYLEGAGLLITLFTIYSYIRAEEGETGWLIAASVGVAAAFLTKYNFGIFLIVAIGLNELAGWLLRGFSALPWQRWLRLGLPAVVIALLWFAAPGRLDRFLGYSRAQEGHYTIWEWASWLYYPQSFYDHYLAGPAALLPVLAGLILALIWWRDGRYRLILLYTLVSWLFLLLVPQKVPRFLYTTAAALLLLGGPFAAWLYEQVAGYGRRVRQLALLLVLAWAIWLGAAIRHQFSYLNPALDVAFDSVPDAAVGYNWISERTLAHGQRVIILNGYHLFSAYALQWQHYRNQGLPKVPLDFTIARTQLAPEPTPANLEALLASWRDQGIAYVVSIDGSPAGLHTGWTVVEPLVSQGYLELVDSSGPLTQRNWDAHYRERTIAAYFASWEEWEQFRQERPGTYEIRLHLYRLNWENR